MTHVIMGLYMFEVLIYATWSELRSQHVHFGCICAMFFYQTFTQIVDLLLQENSSVHGQNVLIKNVHNNHRLFSESHQIVFDRCLAVVFPNCLFALIDQWRVPAHEEPLFATTP